ncbi:ATP-binding protein [Streptomyces alkaliterrae]|uniref:ATP-binding protein n=1 Tax=Streptomyces alkaliterrae TaxID=2213162 RepID=A0A5P0YP41_9ACTN|nr:ATP-binding protein [Streptomyces alkaliterrae]MBB1260956.1 ATP-binding protein [Streptomyces alkaliterrae]MQS02025.1 ATP-binding protein [Streptomyces alkaliterrae]
MSTAAQPWSSAVLTCPGESAPGRSAARGTAGRPVLGPRPEEVTAAAMTTRASCCLAATREAAPAMRHFASGMARCWLLSERVQEAVSVIVTELVANAVLHSDSPEVSLFLTVSPDTLRVEVRDSGHWRPRQEPRVEPLDADVPCGRGLPLVEAYASRTATLPSPRGTRVVADIDLSPADGPAGHHDTGLAGPLDAQRHVTGLG